MTISLPDKAELAKRMCRDERLSDAQCRVGMALLFMFHNTLTGQCNPSYRQLAQASNTSRATALRAVGILEICGVLKIDRTDGGRNQRNGYQFEAVSPAEHFVETVSPAEQASITSETETVSPAEQRVPLVRLAKNTGNQLVNGTREGTREVRNAFEAFSQLATETGLAVPLDLTKERRTKIEKLLREHGPEAWQQALDEISGSSFLCGGSDRGWKITLGWLLKPANFVKVIKGNYRNGAACRGHGKTADFIDALQDAKRGLQ